MYEYVEGGETIRSIVPELDSGFQFRPGCSLRKSSTTERRYKRRLDILLRHNDIQYALYQYLLSLYGVENVGAEVVTGEGQKIDIVVRDGNFFIFYEIKTSSCIRVCIREALSQLLEYSFWSDDERATRLVIVTENDSTENAAKYLAKLRDRFGLPIYHQKFDVQRNVLEEPW